MELYEGVGRCNWKTAMVGICPIAVSGSGTRLFSVVTSSSRIHPVALTSRDAGLPCLSSVGISFLIPQDATQCDTHLHVAVDLVCW